MHARPASLRMRRAVAVGLALVALLATAALVAAGLRCGMVRASACGTPEECDAEAECVSRVHPVALPLAALALVGGAGAWRSLPGVPLGAGVVAAGAGTLFGLSLGFWGIGVGALLVAAGVATPGPPAWARVERTLRWTAVVAATLPPVLMVALLAAGPPSVALAWLVTLGPVLAWFGVLAWAVTRQGS